MSKLKTGLSGCSIELLENGFLRKTSASNDYNHRLSAQIDKQIQFSHFILKNIQTPKILHINKTNLFYFDMEYISALSFDVYLETASKRDLDFILNTLFHYFDFLTDCHKMYSQDIARNKIIDKLHTLKNKTDYDNYIQYLIDWITREPIRIPKTFSHGDLTFSNILFHSNRLYFIDFLDVFIDTFLLDLIKLKQDLFYKWNIKIQNIKSSRLEQVYRYLWNKINEKYFFYLNSQEFKILDVLNALRILPYIDNSIIHNIIQSNEIYKKFIDTNGRKIFTIS